MKSIKKLRCGNDIKLFLPTVSDDFILNKETIMEYITQDETKVFINKYEFSDNFQIHWNLIPNYYLFKEMIEDEDFLGIVSGVFDIEVTI